MKNILIIENRFKYINKYYLINYKVYICSDAIVQYYGRANYLKATFLSRRQYASDA